MNGFDFKLKLIQTFCKFSAQFFVYFLLLGLL